MIYGYRNEEICRAMAEQAMKLPHVMMANVVHDGARDFSDRLAEILPGTLNHVFFSDSGSVSVEIALKMGYQYFVNQKKPRKKILSSKTPTTATPSWRCQLAMTRISTARSRRTLTLPTSP